MRGMGTVINVFLIFVGGLIGLNFGKKIQPKMQDTLFLVTGAAVIFIGIAGALEHMLVITAGHLSSQNALMIICCLAVGALIGEYFDFDEKITRFGNYIKMKTNSANDGMFVNAFVTTSCMVCIGAMAIIGSIQDGINGDLTILVAKGVIDLIIVSIMTTSLGKGCIFSAIPVAIFQGSITFLAVLLNSILTPQTMSNLSCVGSILIFCVGINMVFERKTRVANILPAIVVAVLWGMFL